MGAIFAVGTGASGLVSPLELDADELEELLAELLLPPPPPELQAVANRENEKIRIK